ncbi:ABC transporter permease [Nesterenkonia suensis]
MRDVTTFLRRDLRGSAGRQSALLGMLALMLIGLLVVSGVVAGGIARYSEQARSGSSLNFVEVSESVGSGQHVPLDEVALETVRGVDGVERADSWFQTFLELPEERWPDADANPGGLAATPQIPGRTPDVVAGAIPADGLAPDEIAVPHQVAGGTLDALVGETVTLTYTEVTGPNQGTPAPIELEVVATVDNAVPGTDGPQPAYMDAEALWSLMRDSGVASGGGYGKIFAYVSDPGEVPAVQARIADEGFSVQSVAGQMPGLDQIFRVLEKSTWLLLGVVVLLGLLLGSAVGSTWVRQRTRDIGLLKAVGWSARRILAALTAEFLVLGAVVGAVGTAAGVLLSLGVTAGLSGGGGALAVQAWTPPEPTTIVAALLVVPVCLVLGGLPRALKAARIDADAALRDLGG